MFKESIQKVIHKQPEGTEDIVKLIDIKIPPEFTKCLPTKDKIIAKAKYYNKYKVLEHPIVVEIVTNEKGRPNKLMLSDGYISYLMLLFNGAEYAAVKYLYI